MGQQITNPGRAALAFSGFEKKEVRDRNIGPLKWS